MYWYEITKKYTSGGNGYLTTDEENVEHQLAFILKQLRNNDITEFTVKATKK